MPRVSKAGAVADAAKAADDTLSSVLVRQIPHWPKDTPMTATHIASIMLDPAVQKAMGGDTTAESLVKAIAAQPADYWKTWVSQNVSGSAEKVTRQTAKPQGKAAAAGGGGTPTSDLRKRAAELGFAQKDIDKMSDDEVKFNVESVEAAAKKAKSKDAELAEKRQAQRDKNVADRQRIAEKKAAAAEKKAAGKPAKQSTRIVGADKEVVSSGGESRSNVKDTPASAVDLDGLSVDELSQALAKARVRDAMGSSQNVGVQLGQPGSTFTDMTSGSPAMDAVPGVAPTNAGSITVGAGMTPELAERLKTEVNPLTGTPLGAPARSVPVVNGQLAGSFEPPAEPFFKGFDALRGNPFGTYQKMDGTGKPIVDGQGNPVMADRWARSLGRNTPAALVKYVAPAAAVAYGAKPLIQFFASMRNQQPASDGIAEAVEARIRMQQRFGNPGEGRPTYVPDTPPAR